VSMSVSVTVDQSLFVELGSCWVCCYNDRCLDGLTPMPGHSPLFLGIVPYQGLQSKVVDTARFVLPRDRAEQLDGDFLDDRASHLVMIDEGRWALACRRIGDVVELEPTDVKWRTANGKRPWLAGTVIERMCALLDIDQLTEQLVEGISLA